MRLSTRSLVPAFVLFAVALLIVGTLGASDSQPQPPTSPLPTVVRIYYDDIRDLSALSSYDLFEYNDLDERFVLATVSHAERQQLARLGWTIVQDPVSTAQISLGRQTYYGGYRTVDELYLRLRDVAEQNPAFTELVDYGESHCLAHHGCVAPGGETTSGFPLLALRVTNESIPGGSIINGSQIERGQKPVLFILAGIHAREMTPPEIAMRWIDHLLENYGEDPDITWIVDHNELWIAPVANPDGRWVVELGENSAYGGFPLLHRKNFNQDADNDGQNDCAAWPSSDAGQPGVDLNRNYDFGWLPPDTWTSPCSLTYSGQAAASELEVTAHQALIRSLFADQRGPDLDDAAPVDTSGIFLTLHNYGDLVLRPWAFMGDAAPNEKGLRAIGDKLAALANYRSCRSPQCLYFAHGTTDDWTYGELGMASYTVEIGSYLEGFTPPYAVIDGDQWPRNREAFLYAARIAAQPYLLALGPDVRDVAAREEESGIIVTVSANVYGDQPIAAAEMSVDALSQTELGNALPMDAADGSFDSTAEDVTITLDLRSYATGRHTAFIRGKDGSGNYGPVKAVYFSVPGYTFLPLFFPR